MIDSCDSFSLASCDRARLAIGSDGCVGGTSIQRLHRPITIAQNLASKDVKNLKMAAPYPGYFGFTSVQWEEVEARCPSIYTDLCSSNTRQAVATSITFPNLQPNCRWSSCMVGNVGARLWQGRRICGIKKIILLHQFQLFLQGKNCSLQAATSFTCYGHSLWFYLKELPNSH